MRAAPIVLAAGLAVACGEDIEAPEPPADLDASERVAAGRPLYLEHCALCHGERADGEGRRSEHFEQSPRDFTQPGWKDQLPPKKLYVLVRDGKQGTAMPSYSWLEEEQIWSLVAYLRSVPRDSR